MTYHKIDPFGVVSKVANVKGAYIDCQFDIQIRKGTNELMYLKLGTQNMNVVGTLNIRYTQILCTSHMNCEFDIKIKNGPNE